MSDDELTSDEEEPEESQDDIERAEQELVARSDLTLMVMLRDQIQNLRIREGNRAKAAEKLEEQQRFELHLGYRNRLHDMEEDITRMLKPHIEAHPAWPWLKDIRGIAQTSAALVIGYIDIERCDTISALWRFAGYGTVDGKAERAVKGELRHYNARLKSMVWRVTDLQIRLRGPYRVTYDNAKHRYLTTRGPDTTHPDKWTLGHCENAARRAASKLFLAHLWLVWREALGLPTRGPWIEQYGDGQHDIIDPWKFTGRERPEEGTDG